MTSKQILRYLQLNADSELTVFENSSHFPHLEEPVDFAAKVKNFILG